MDDDDRTGEPPHMRDMLFTAAAQKILRAARGAAQAAIEEALSDLDGEIEPLEARIEGLLDQIEAVSDECCETCYSDDCPDEGPCTCPCTGLCVAEAEAERSKLRAELAGGAMERDVHRYVWERLGDCADDGEAFVRPGWLFEEDSVTPAVTPDPATPPVTKLCACGCGRPITSPRPEAKYATGACRVRAHRAR